MKCLNCGKTVKQTKGKRAKSYCNPTCRQQHWQKKNRETNPPVRPPGRPKGTKKTALPAATEDAHESGINESIVYDESGKPVFKVDHTKALTSGVDFTPVSSKSFDAEEIKNFTHDEPPMWNKPKEQSQDLQNTDITLPGGLGTVQTGDGTTREIEKVVKKPDGSVTLTIGAKSKEKQIEEVEAEVVSSAIKLPTKPYDLKKMAEAGVADKDTFKKHIDSIKLSPGERTLILSKLK